MEGSNIWWPLEKKRKTSFSPLLTLPPNKFCLNLFFPLILMFYFTMVLDRYFTPFPPFLWPINYNHTFQCAKIFTHSLPNWFWSKILSFLWIHGVMHDHILWALSHTSEWRTNSEIIPRFDINAASSRWRSRTVRGVPTSWNWTPSSLVLLHFFELSHLSDFVANRPCFWWWT